MLEFFRRSYRPARWSDYSVNIEVYHSALGLQLELGKSKATYHKGTSFLEAAGIISYL